MDVHAEVSVFDELGYDEDASIWCARETEVKNDIRMARLPGGRQLVGKADYGLDIWCEHSLHEPPFPLEVLGDVIVI